MANRKTKFMHVVLATSLGLGFAAVHSSAQALPSCKDMGKVYFEQNINKTSEWQSYLSLNLQSNQSINSVAEAFGTQQCASYFNAPPNPRPFMRQFDITHKACSFRKPDAVINGTTVDHGGSPSNPGLLRQSGCRKVLEKRKMQRVNPIAAQLRPE